MKKTLNTIGNRQKNHFTFNEMSKICEPLLGKKVFKVFLIENGFLNYRGIPSADFIYSYFDPIFMREDELDTNPMCMEFYITREGMIKIFRCAMNYYSNQVLKN